MSEQVPAAVRSEVALALGTDDAPDTIRRVDPLGGGCIHPAARIETEGGHVAFVKWSGDQVIGNFSVEARGLDVLRAAGAIRIPEVLGVEEESKGQGWLLMEFIPGGRPTPQTGLRLGRELAALHSPLDGARPGWEEDGFIGALPQGNRGPPTWPAFWREARLRPQWERAVAAARIPTELWTHWERVEAGIEVLLEGWETDGICLLHGDLWRGNVLVDLTGAPVLIDPAVYRGHREVDLAMMELFGGFPETTFQGYGEARPLAAGYAERRRNVYQLYPLLVHLNLFGGGYLGSIAERLRRLAAIAPPVS